MKDGKLKQQKAQAQFNEKKADIDKRKAKQDGVNTDSQLVANKQDKQNNDLAEKELYQQKRQAQLDEWKAEIAKLKAKASGASADTQLEIHTYIRELESKSDEVKVKLTELASTSGDAWKSLTNGLESAWDSLKHGVSEAVTKFRE